MILTLAVLNVVKNIYSNTVLVNLSGLQLSGRVLIQTVLVIRKFKKLSILNPIFFIFLQLVVWAGGTTNDEDLLYPLKTYIVTEG